MLGHHRPGSEGNLASDIENQDPAVNTATNGEAVQNVAVKPEVPPAKSEKSDGSRADGNKAEGKPKADGRAKAEKTAAEAKPPAEPKPPAELKPVVEANPDAEVVPAEATEVKAADSSPAPEGGGPAPKEEAAAPMPSGRLFDNRRRAQGNQG